MWDFQVSAKNSRITVNQDIECTAKNACSGLESGATVFGFTLGQFSVSDLIAEILKVTGPADVNISTWTASAAKIEEAFALFESGAITRCRFLLDPGFKSRQPIFSETLVAKFGIESIRTIANHAKFATFKNENWNVVLKTSMNLNNNPRLENYEITDNPQLWEFINGFMDYVFETFSPDDNYKLAGHGGIDSMSRRQQQESDLLAMMD